MINENERGKIINNGSFCKLNYNISLPNDVIIEYINNFLKNNINNGLKFEDKFYVIFDLIRDITGDGWKKNDEIAKLLSERYKELIDVATLVIEEINIKKIKVEYYLEKTIKFLKSLMIFFEENDYDNCAIEVYKVFIEKNKDLCTIEWLEQFWAKHHFVQVSKKENVLLFYKSEVSKLGNGAKRAKVNISKHLYQLKIDNDLNYQPKKLVFKLRHDKFIKFSDKNDLGMYKKIYNYILRKGIDGVSRETFRKNFPRIKKVVSDSLFTGKDIVVYKDKIYHISAFIETEEKENDLKLIIDQFLNDGNIHNIHDLAAYIELQYPDFAKKLRINNFSLFYSILMICYKDLYSFKKPFIAPIDVNIETQILRIRKFVEAKEELSILELKNFISENQLKNNSIIQIIDNLENYIFKNENTIVRIDTLNFDKYKVETIERIILKEMKDNKQIFIDRINNTHLFPVDIEWNEWIIYSLINKFSKELKAVPVFKNLKQRVGLNARPLILKKDVPYFSMKGYIEYLKKEMKMDGTEFYKYLKIKELI